MTLMLTARELHLVAQELSELVVPSRIQKIFEASPRRLVFQLRSPGETHYLLISFAVDDTRLHLVEGKPDQAGHPSPFTMLLRKWLHGAWIEAVVPAEDDRILHLDVQVIDPDWEPVSDDERAPRQAMTLIAESLGRHPNLVLVDHEGRLVATGPGPLLGDRSRTPGESYQAPPAPPPHADDQEVRDALAGLPADGSRSQALDHHFCTLRESLALKDALQSLRGDLKTHHKRLKRRVKAIEGDLERIEDADLYRRRGELLQTAYGAVEPGATSVAVPDYYQEGMPEVEIPLDPAKSLQRNIDHYFHQYRRYSAARDQVETRLLESIEKRDQLARRRQQLDDLLDPDEIEAFRQQLVHQGLLPRRSTGRGKRSRRQGPLPPYREFRAQSGATILVGRNARHNDTLTSSVARGRDLWLHARDWRGSHVVLRMEKNQEINSEDLIDAATLAAHFSKGRSNTAVDVTYTHAKYVRKPTGAAVGTVTVGGGSTIAVRLDGPRLQRLLNTEIDHR